MSISALTGHQEELSRAVQALADQWSGVDEADADTRDKIFDRVTNQLFRKHSMLAAIALTTVYRALQTAGPVTVAQLPSLEACAKCEVILWFARANNIRTTCQRWMTRCNPWHVLSDDAG
jgi:hypothetical protein